jgi:hypothetical protein
MSATNPVAVSSQHLQDSERLLNTRADTPKLFLAPEPFVSAQEAADFMGISRRFLMELARRGITGAYPIGTGAMRKTWVFRLSELAAAIDCKQDTNSRRPPECEQAYHPIIRRSLLK